MSFYFTLPLTRLECEHLIRGLSFASALKDLYLVSQDSTEYASQLDFLDTLISVSDALQHRLDMDDSRVMSSAIVGSFGE